MRKVDRGEFMHKSVEKKKAYENKAQPIDYNVVISQPLLHCFCMEWLESKLKPGARVLDVGCGSGYLCATFYEMVKKADPNLMDTTFGQDMQEFISASVKSIENLTKKRTECKKKYEEVCDYYVIDKSDQMRSKLDKFIEFFTKYFENVDMAIYPEKYKKKKK